MNKDQVKGKAKDIAGRVERQVGEWTGDTEHQVKGAVKQVEGKVQNAWGNAKDEIEKEKAKKDAPASSKPPQRVPEADEADETDVRHSGR
jgi:uncharacterized protein YjbJ (UPF0337 family)